MESRVIGRSQSSVWKTDRTLIRRTKTNEVHQDKYDTARRAVGFARSGPALWNAKPIPLGSRDRAKKIHTLCALSASVVKQSSKYPSVGSPAARDRRARDQNSKPTLLYNMAWTTPLRSGTVYGIDKI